MGKDKVPKAPAPAAPTNSAGKGNPAAGGSTAPAISRPPKGHKQRGAGTVITAKPAIVTEDGIVLKAHEVVGKTYLFQVAPAQNILFLFHISYV